MSLAVSELEQNQVEGRAAIGVSRVRQEPNVLASLELSPKMAGLYALEEEDFQVFRDLCDAFNSLGKSRLGDPFGAEPFQYLHEDVDFRTIPAFRGRRGTRGTLEPCSGPRISGSRSGTSTCSHGSSSVQDEAASSALPPLLGRVAAVASS